ncbi:hypothetical protein D917_03845 [Trichinella nativa]|uniref:Uncharacterized protein n=1 Tax=Trichinella nativa TaxID=6335 RepID=A0A1Y3E6I9_9BILA|nr:hypothetical protein D917_03845 [Trichinella nativa]
MEVSTDRTIKYKYSRGSECSVRLNSIFGLIQNENVKRLAHIACNSLCADPEPPRSTVTKELSVSSNELRVYCCKMSMPGLSNRMRTLTVDQNSFLHHGACLNAYHTHVVLIHYQEFRKHNLFAEIYALKMQNLYRSSDLGDAVLKLTPNILYKSSPSKASQVCKLR